jgi:glycine betaine/proline transport system substrate-binding protein
MEVYFMKRILAGLAVAVLALAACSPNGGTSGGHIKLADAGWDSIRFHNAVVGFIAESAYDMTWEEVPGSTPITYEGLKSGEIDVYTEVWSDNLPTYQADLQDGLFLELAVNFGDNAQGIYVPTYVIEGDADRGIEPMAPNLRTVQDLANYPDVFVDDDDPSMGRLYGAIPGWAADDIMRKKFDFNNLGDTFVYFSPGSDAALSAALTAAYDRGEAIAGYYWEPTWLMGMYDFTLLEDYPYDAETFLEGETAFPSGPVTVGVRTGFDDEFPEFTSFLSNYETSSELTSIGLAYMLDTGANYEETAKWFISEYSDLISAMMPSDKWDLVVAALD